MPSNRERVVKLIRTSSVPLDDDQIAQRTGISPRQTVNTICRHLAQDGLVRRVPGPDGKIVNQWIQNPTPGPEGTRSDGVLSESTEPSEAHPGTADEQRRAQAFLLEQLGEHLGLVLNPTRISVPSGARVEVDGADDGRSVLVECWAHQGPPKPAQKHKLLADALKLTWIATTIYPRPRLILCLSDDAAAAPFIRGSRSWASQALADLGVAVMVVDLPKDVRQAVLAAQERQYR